MIGLVISLGAFAQEYLLIQLHDIGGFAGRLVTGIDTKIQFSVSIQIILAGPREIRTMENLLNTLASFPAIQISPTETLLCQLNHPFATDLQDNPFVRTADIGIAVLSGSKIPIRLGVGFIQFHVRHSRTLTQQVHGFVKIRLRQGTQFGQSLCIIQIDFTHPIHRKVIIRLIQTVRRGIILRHDEFVILKTSNTAVEIHAYDILSVNSLVTRQTDSLAKTGITIGDLILELHDFPARFIRETSTIFHKIGIYHFLGHTGTTLRCHGCISSTIMEYLHTGIKLDCHDILFTIGIVSSKQIDVILIRFAGIIQRERAFRHQAEGCCRCFLQIKGLIVAFESKPVIFAERSLEQAETGLEGHGSPFRHAIIGATGIRSRQMLNGIVNVFNHMAHHHFPGITGIIERFICGTQFMFDPRDITKSLYFIEIEESTPEFA